MTARDYRTIGELRTRLQQAHDDIDVLRNQLEDTERTVEVQRRHIIELRRIGNQMAAKLGHKTDSPIRAAIRETRIAEEWRDISR